MSLVRWGQDGSGVFVYNGENGIVCCCTKGEGGGSFVCKYDDEMAAHLREHEKDGWTIPGWVFSILEGKESKFLYENQVRPTPERKPNG